MTTVTFEAEPSEIDKIKNVLKALGAKKIKVKETEESKYPQFDKTEYTKKEFEAMLDFSKKTKTAKKLKTKQEISDFIDSL